MVSSRFQKNPGASTRQTDRVVVDMILIGLLWLALDFLIFRPIERATVRKWGVLA